MKLYGKSGGTAPRIVNLETDETEASKKITFVQLKNTRPRINQRAHTRPHMVPINQVLSLTTCHLHIQFYIILQPNNNNNYYYYYYYYWVVTRWQWLLYMYTKYEIGY